MSSILKALKKLEDDRVARQPEQLKIDADILKSDNAPRFSPSGAIMASLLLLAIGSGMTYMYMKRDASPELSGRTSPPASSGIKTEQLPEAVAVVPAVPQKPAKTGTVILPQSAPPVAARKAPPAAARPVVAQKPAGAPKSVEHGVVAEQAVPAPPQVKPPPPALRVNGIAFEDGNTESVAMVNGTPVTKGSLIEGVKVEDIHKNRVKFSYNGEKFEITLGQSNR